MWDSCIWNCLMCLGFGHFYSLCFSWAWCALHCTCICLRCWDGWVASPPLQPDLPHLVFPHFPAIHSLGSYISLCNAFNWHWWLLGMVFLSTDGEIFDRSIVLCWDISVVKDLCWKTFNAHLLFILKEIVLICFLAQLYCLSHHSDSWAIY